MRAVAVARYFNPYEAGLAASFLQGHGIQASVADSHFSSIDPLMPTALGGIRIMVPSPEAEDATALLVAAERGEFASEDAEAPAAPAQRSPLITAGVLAAVPLLGGYGALAFVPGRGPAKPILAIGQALLLILAAVFAWMWLSGR